MNNDTLINDWEKYLQVEREFLLPQAHSYKLTIQMFLTFFIKRYNYKPRNLLQADTYDIQLFIGKRLDTEAPASVALRLCIIKHFYKYCKRLQYIAKDPAKCIQPPRYDYRSPNILDINQIKRLFGKGFRSARDKLVIELFYGLGLMRTDLIELKVGNINLKDSEIHVAIGHPRKERILPISSFVRRAALQCYVQERYENSWLFPSPHRDQHISLPASTAIVKKYLTHIKDATTTPGVLRSTCAAHMIANGASERIVRALLGMTSNSSLHQYPVSQKELFETYFKTHPRAKHQRR